MTLRNQKAFFALLWPAPPFPTSLCLDSGFQTHHLQMQKNVKARDVYCGFFFFVTWDVMEVTLLGWEFML